MNAKPEDLPPVPDTDSRGWVMRQARTSDVPQIRRLIDLYAPDRRLLSKATVALYEDVQEFVVLEADAKVLATGALHVMWADLGEIRTVAVDPSATGRGFGSEVVEALIARARALDLGRVFCLTFETEFFTRFGFEHLEGAPVSAEVFAELLHSGDEGVAEFLDLERVKPNTLGNERLLLRLQ